MDELTAFLRARLDEDERIAAAAPIRGTWTILLAGDPDGGEVTERRVLDHVLHFDPTRALAEVAAKRAILAELDGPFGLDLQALYKVLRHLAKVYADHPDYRDAWY